MTRTSSKLGSYQTDYQAARQQRATEGPPWFQELGDQSWSRFTELGFPTARRANERWKYTNVGPIAKATFSYSWDLDPDTGPGTTELKQIAPWSDDWVNLVFVDGRLSKALSTATNKANGIGVSSLADAFRSDGRSLEAHLGKHAGFEDEGFTALNTAFLRDGALVEVPDGYGAGPAIHLLFVTTEREQPRVCYPRTLVLVGRNASVTVVETYVGQSDVQYFTNAVTEVALEDGSTLEHYRLLLESPQAYHVGTSRVHQGQDSTFTSASFAMGTALARNDFQVLLDAPGSSCTLNGLYLTSGTQHIDNLISIDHAQPHTTSRLAYKGILGGRSKAVFGGEVLVRKDAQKADAQQSDKNLLLSEYAEIDSKPSLLIYADDVKCGHGATAGHLDESAMFYLRSRGLSPEEASRMLTHAFAREIIDRVKLDPLAEYLDERFLGVIPAGITATGGGA